MESVDLTDAVVNILLVDDKPNNLIALEAILASPDYNLVTATSGAAGLKCLKQREFAVILADVMMPIMDGFEFAARVKDNEQWRETPIIFLTAMASEVSNVFRGYEVGAVDYLQKPLEPEFVKAKVAVFVQLYRQRCLNKRQAEELLEAYRALDAKVKERTAALEVAKAELQVAKELAEAGSSAKSAFLANMSHEIRTPLGAVMGFSELLLVPDQSVSEKENFVAAIKRNGKLLLNIINDVLDLSKVEAGKLDVERVAMPLDEILTDLNMLLDFEASEKGLKLTVSTEGDVPERITTDPLRLRQILLNIVGNAIKFTDRGAVDVKITQMFASDGKNKLAFVVCDSGRGISAEQAGHLFEPFAQADSSTTRKFGGTGLGLALSKQLANALGGDVELTQSDLGKGCTFTVTIDPGVCHADGARSFTLSPIRPPGRTRDMPIRLTHMKVLLAEDSIDNQVLVSHMLRMSGASVDTASNGREAIDMAQNGDYSVVLMDLQMPEMDGYAATRELRNGGYQKPIIALTAHAMAEERRRCLANGFNGHLSKPINRNALLQAIVEFGGGKVDGEGVSRHERALEGWNILVVDDEPDTLSLVSKVLQLRGADVTAVASVDDALAAMKSLKPDVLLSDIAMPGKDGLDLIRAIRGSNGANATLPAAALTAYTRPDERCEAIAAGFQTHLTKPVEPDMLVATLVNLASHRKKARTNGGKHFEK